MADHAGSAPLAAARHAHVLAALERDGSVRISALTEELGITPVTLRRDLVQMERDGLLRRVHGGAVRAIAHEDRDELARTRPSGSIAVLVPSLNYYWPGVLRGIESAARELGFRIVLRGASYELQDERPVLERLLQDPQIKGLLVAPNIDSEHAQDVVQWLAGARVPSVLIERDAITLPSHGVVESVTTAHDHGARLAAWHLDALGHRHVGLVLSRNSPTSRKIRSGWADAWQQMGVSNPFEVLLPERSGSDFAPAVHAALDAAEREGVTALLVHSDPEAMAIVDLAMARGVRVPGDLSIVAYDDEVAQLFSPALTAIAPPRFSVGEHALRLLVDRIHDPDGPARRTVLAPALVQRESTGPVR